ncbi:histidine kinase [Aequorivita capsosiphonis]|uniref:histidine kinase n=1 Tax=Aequorivita capsosiphonis TaxID=487317 RepID=UPI0003F50E13|nr:histidine kinase [Aequorivita capsosiphonis]
MADSINYNLALLNNKEVQALRTSPESTFEEIQKHTDWKSYNTNYTPTPESTIWLKFKIENQSRDTVHSFLYSRNHYTTIYQQKKSGFEKFKNGFYVPLSQRANKSINYFTPLSLAPNQQSELYVRLKVLQILGEQSVPALYSEKGYFKHLRSDYEYEKNAIAFISFYLISLITIMVFAVVFWFTLVKRLYVYYLGYLFFQLIYGFIVLGRTLAPAGNITQHIPKLAEDLFEPAQFAFIGFYVFFILNLISVKKYDKLLAQILKYLGFTCFLYAIFRFVFSHYFYNPELTSILFNTIRIIILPINFILIFWVIYKVKHPLLIYFIIGQSFFFIGALIASLIGSNILEAYSMLHFSQSANIIFQIGLLAEVYCFSLALGKNVFILRKEKNKTTDALIAQLKENQLLQITMNHELDEKVNKKTEELIQLYTELEKEREQKIKDDFEQRIKEIEMIALRSQMNPHFIFNSLTAIKFLIMDSRNEYAIDYLDDFSSLLRGILQNSNRKKITVEEELEILELYLSLEKNRMGEEFIYDIQCTSKETLSQYEIPPLLLQPIVENAIWHGLHPSLKAGKKLTVIFDTTDNLKIIIEDNGVGRKESAKSKKLHDSMGTKIVHDRLTLFNHLNAPFIRLKTIDLEEDGKAIGTRITLTYQN